MRIFPPSDVIKQNDTKETDEDVLGGQKSITLTADFQFRKSIAVDAPRIFIKKKGKHEVLPMGKRSALMKQSKSTSRFDNSKNETIENRLEEPSFDLSNHHHNDEEFSNVGFETFEDVINGEKQKNGGW